MSGRDFLKHLHDGLKISPISVRHLIALKAIPCDVLTLVDGVFQVVLKEGTPVNIPDIKALMTRGHQKFFIKESDKERIIEATQQQLILISRALSIGQQDQNAKKMIGLLTLHLELLYDDVASDQMLQLHTQSSKNLCKLIIEHPELGKDLLAHFSKQKYHYLFAQPLLASFFLILFLKQMRIFNEREMEALFITSYLKDIGMSIVPLEKLEQTELSQDDKNLINDHPKHSILILEGRLSLPQNYFGIIKHHHVASDLLAQDQQQIEEQNALSGFETMIVSVMDILAAKTSDRPYRKADQVFTSLEHIKNIIGERYPSEFKLLVIFFKNLYAAS